MSWPDSEYQIVLPSVKNVMVVWATAGLSPQYPGTLVAVTRAAATGDWLVSDATVMKTVPGWTVVHVEVLT